MKIVSLLIVSPFIISTIFAYDNPYRPYMPKDDPKMQKYQDNARDLYEFSEKHKGVHGEIKKNTYGNGYTYRDNSGRVVQFQEKPYGLGGYDVYSNE